MIFLNSLQKIIIWEDNECVENFGEKPSENAHFDEEKIITLRWILRIML
jgi:hypothetical protein